MWAIDLERKCAVLAMVQLFVLSDAALQAKFDRMLLKARAILSKCFAANASW